MGLFSGIADLAGSLVSGDWMGALGAAGGIGDAFSARSLEKDARKDLRWINAQNLAEAERNRQFQDKQAQDSRTFAQNILTSQQNFTQNMSNTAYQRAVADLRKAGLNPMLATGHPASTPSGGSAASIPIGGGAVGKAMPVVAQAATTAAQVRAVDAEAALKTAQQRVANSQAILNMASAQKAEQDARTGVSTAAHLDAMSKRIDRLLPAELEKYTEEIVNIFRDSMLKDAQTESERARVRDITAATKEKSSRTQLLQLESLMKSLDMNRAKNESQAQKSWFMKNIAPYLKSIGIGAGAAQSAASAKIMLAR